MYVVGSALLSITFFVYQGWLEIAFLGKILKCLDCTSKIDDSLLTADEQAAALTRAKEEEQRRQEEADARRSFQSATRNVERVMNIRASTGAAIRPTFSAMGAAPPLRSNEPTTNPLQSHASSPPANLPPGTIVVKRRRLSTVINKPILSVDHESAPPSLVSNADSVVDI